MSFRTSLSTRRRVCVATLAAWVFAIASGAVNGCVLTASEPGEAHSTLVATTSAEPDCDHDSDQDDDAGKGLAAEHEVGHSHSASDDEHGDSHPGCHKFCKDSGGTLPKQASVGSPDLSHPLLVASVVYLTPSKSVPVVQREAEHPWANDPPIVIRFLRLTL
jgi:hypothetical protein